MICAVSSVLVVAFFTPSSWLHSVSHVSSDLSGKGNTSESNYSTLSHDVLPVASSVGSTTAFINNNTTTMRLSNNNTNYSGKNKCKSSVSPLPQERATRRFFTLLDYEYIETRDTEAAQEE